MIGFKVLLLVVVGVSPYLIRMGMKLYRARDDIVAWVLAEPEKEPPIIVLEQLTTAKVFEAATLLVCDYKLLLGWAFIAMLILHALRWIVKQRLLRLVLRLRGFSPEAMKDGSPFTNGRVPDYQVELCEAGLLTDKFVGYGIRYKNVLVTPKHVADKITNMIIVGKKSKELVNNSYLQSEVVADLVYIVLSPEIWSRLGVSEAKKSQLLHKTTANCSGKEGTSTGFIRKMPQVGMLAFSGSTVPGMSGAAYYTGTMVIGIHDGVSNSENVGISIHVIDAEVKEILCGESFHGGATDEGLVFVNGKAVRTKDQTDRELESWNLDTINKKSRSAWSHSQTDVTERRERAKARMEDPDAWFLEEEECNKFASLDSQNFLNLISAVPDEKLRAWQVTMGQYLQQKSRMNIQGQSDDPVAVDIGPSYQSIVNAQVAELYSDFPPEVRDSIKRAPTRITLLEQEVRTMWDKFKEMQEKPTPVQFTQRHLKCDQCNRLFKNVVALTVHKSMKHQEMEMVYRSTTVPVQGESAFSADVKTAVGTDKKPAFLEKRLGRMNMRPLQNTLKLSKPSQSPSQSQQVSQSPVTEYQKAIGDISKVLQQALAGLASDMQQN